MDSKNGRYSCIKGRTSERFSTTETGKFQWFWGTCYCFIKQYTFLTKWFRWFRVWFRVWFECLNDTSFFVVKHCPISLPSKWMCAVFKMKTHMDCSSDHYDNFGNGKLRKREMSLILYISSHNTVYTDVSNILGTITCTSDFIHSLS